MTRYRRVQTILTAAVRHVGVEKNIKTAGRAGKESHQGTLTQFILHEAELSLTAVE